MYGLTRRKLLKSAAAASSLALLNRTTLAADPTLLPLQEFAYNQVRITGTLQTAQRENVTTILTSLDPDSLLKPFRQMAGQPAPGQSLGGWYEWNPAYDHHHGDAGFAPGHALGQWTSALARLHAASTFGNTSGIPDLADRANRLNHLLADAITPAFFAQTRFPSYTLDKLTCGLMDAHRLLNDPAAFPALERVVTAAEPSLPGRAIDRDIQWKLNADISYMWDEHYILPENLFLAASLGAGPRFRRLAETYLLDQTFFEPLSRGVNVLGDKHAYSHVNALCSAMQACFVNGSAMHLKSALNAFDFLEQQSFATGGWGPEELLRAPGYDELAKSLTAGHNGFETPCGSYAHMKLTRYLLRATRDGRYGDSMERVFVNTILGALPLQPDGRTFYSADYNILAKRIYSVHRWPCCSGTHPQVVADYGINTYLHEPGTVHEPGAVWVILYQPSELRWTENGHALSLEQTGTYPDDGTIILRLTAQRPTTFTLRLRIPAWAGTEAKLQINRQPVPFTLEKSFTAITRQWRTGDQIQLDLPMSLRLEPLPPDGPHVHPDTVALMRGPLVLFPLREPTETGPLTLSRTALLQAEPTAPREWSVSTSTSPRRFVPFPGIGDRTYSTYITAS